MRKTILVFGLFYSFSLFAQTHEELLESYKSCEGVLEIIETQGFSQNSKINKVKLCKDLLESWEGFLQDEILNFDDEELRELNLEIGEIIKKHYKFTKKPTEKKLLKVINAHYLLYITLFYEALGQKKSGEITLCEYKKTTINLSVLFNIARRQYESFIKGTGFSTPAVKELLDFKARVFKEDNLSDFIDEYNEDCL